MQNLSLYARRMGALFYDGLLLIAFWLLATFCLVLVSGRALIAPGAGTVTKVPYWLFLSLIAWAFFSWFWSHGGQTLGMRAWKLRLNSEARSNSEPGGHPVSVTWMQASHRFVVVFGIWLLAGGAVIVPVWNVMTADHFPIATRVTSLLCVWVAASWILSLIPVWRGKNIVDALSNTRIVRI